MPRGKISGGIIGKVHRKMIKGYTRHLTGYLWGVKIRVLGKDLFLYLASL